MCEAIYFLSSSFLAQSSTAYSKIWLRAEAPVKVEGTEYCAMLPHFAVAVEVKL